MCITFFHFIRWKFGNVAICTCFYYFMMTDEGWRERNSDFALCDDRILVHFDCFDFIYWRPMNNVQYIWHCVIAKGVEYDSDSDRYGWLLILGDRSEANWICEIVFQQIMAHRNIVLIQLFSHHIKMMPLCLLSPIFLIAEHSLTGAHSCSSRENLITNRLQAVSNAF